MKYNKTMRVITRTRIEDFKKKHPDSVTSLDLWYDLITKNHFDNLMALKTVFGNKVDIVAKGYIFNISGNKYRLAASIHFNTQMVFIREIMTHAEYSKEDWKKQHKDFH